MASKTREKRHSNKAEDSQATSTTSNDIRREVSTPQPLAALVNTKLLPAGFTIPELLPDEERARLKRYFIPKWSLPPCEEDYFFDSTVIPIIKTPEEFSLNEFPDELLVEVFRRIHCFDRIHSVSLVCRRWNRLLYTVGLWKSVHMTISTKKRFLAAKAFLKRDEVSHSLIKLDIRYSKKINGPEGDVLPKKLPKLSYYRSDGEIVDSGLEFLDKVMPTLQILILKYVRFRKDHFLKNDPPDSFSADASKCLFQKLQKLAVRESIFRIFPWRENLKELNIWGKNCETEILNSGALEKLAVRKLLFQPTSFRNSSISPKLVTLDIRFCYNSFCLNSQFIAAVRNLHLLQHLHIYVGDPSFPLQGLFAPPQKKFDFPSRLKYLSLSYEDSFVVEEITLNCPELRSLYLKTINCECVISESIFIQIAERLRNLEYLRVSYVSSSIASMLNALGEDALPQLRYLHSGIIRREIPPTYGLASEGLSSAVSAIRHVCYERSVDDVFRNMSLSEMTDLESLVSKRPTLTIVSGQLTSNIWFINGKVHESVDRSLLRRLLGSEEGACCTALYDINIE